MKYPKIRFKGNTTEWQTTLLNEWLIPSKKKNVDLIYDKNDVLSVSGEFGVVNQIQFHGKSFAGASVKNYGVVNTGNIVYTKSPLRKQPYGIIKSNKGEAGIVSTLYAIYKSVDSTYPDFIEEYFNNDKRLNDYLRPLVRKGAKNDMKVSSEGALQGLVTFPQKNEQIQISEFLGQMSKLIVSLNRKIECLEKLKQSMLTMMFPQEGELVPQIRFKGFEKEWNKVEFGSLLDECLEKSTTENEDVLLSSAINGVFLNSELFDHQRGKSNIGYRKIKKDMLILSAQNLHLGNANVNLRFEHGLISPAYKIYNLLNVNPLFMHQWIKRDSTKTFFLNATTAGASLCRKNIVWEDLYKQSLLIPSKEEQEFIGKFFIHLDRDISLQIQRLEKLKQIKLACLDKMFV